ncbi:hypothetical protein BDW42DRAFT_165351 [Aspergillus taichungensis]|uniref:Spindle pole body-associated protein cut12 domain-containing protein n=1 Tax=Aspergillus taichungensis TaxID=482145 RepID=A0A2J5I089_9EURO|nr:hypothetical protein BDW42DRAFT_165351 [Aspergillus taichungensis]
MLEWISGPNDQIAGDKSQVVEPPETPAPVFAIRAFKSALFGTPGEEDDEKTPKPKTLPADRSRGDSDVLRPPTLQPSTKTDAGPTVNNMSSPTKSILVTPGTASNRRKTVSFGDGVVDNERRREQPEKPQTPASTTGPLSSQWSVDSKGKPRSKLTQALLDSREQTARSVESTYSRTEQSSSKPITKAPAAASQEDNNDDTINLDEPRSQSGKYWKAEFDSYRNRTTREIRKLIQYRSAAKQYARKKDAEALRLSDKLKEEEIKVADMERHVTQLASTMVEENTNADKEKLVQDLTKQTALALQYKHRVGLLRKLLEQHGVVGVDADADDATNAVEPKDAPDAADQQLRKTQQALGQANAKITEMKRQDTEFNQLKDLARSSERKASELEKENINLKQTLARVKQEMTKYEGRRKEKEAKLRQREAKLETRIQEYRERLKTASQQRRETEEDLKQSFNDERQQMLEQIDLLKLKVATIERLPELRARANRYSESPRKGHTGVPVFDIGQTSPQREPQYDETEEVDEPPSPSPRAAKNQRSHQHARNTLGELELRRAAQTLGLETRGERPYSFAGESPLKPNGGHYHEESNIAALPPSSPPDYPSLKPTSHHATAETAKHKYDLDNYRSYRPSHTSMTALAHHLASLDTDNRHQVRHDRLRTRRRSPVKYSLDAVSQLPDAHTGADRPRRRQSLATVQRDSIPAERMLAAQARLKRKDDSRKGKVEGKENIRTYSH